MVEIFEAPWSSAKGDGPDEAQHEPDQQRLAAEEHRAPGPSGPLGSDEHATRTGPLPPWRGMGEPSGVGTAGVPQGHTPKSEWSATSAQLRFVLILIHERDLDIDSVRYVAGQLHLGSKIGSSNAINKLKASGHAPFDAKLSVPEDMDVTVLYAAIGARLERLRQQTFPGASVELESAAAVRQRFGPNGEYRVEFAEKLFWYGRLATADNWCQLCGQPVHAGDVAWQLEQKRRGKSQKPWVCGDCFWSDAEPDAQSVLTKIRFRASKGNAAALNLREAEVLLESLDQAVSLGWEPWDPSLPRIADSLATRLRNRRANLTNEEARVLADAVASLDGMEEPDPRSLDAPKWLL